MTEETENNFEDEQQTENDDFEPVIMGLLENADALGPMMNLLTKLKNSGLLEAMENISAEFLPSDIEFLSSFLTSKDFLYGLVKTVNVVSSVAHAMSSEKGSDAVKAIMYNSNDIWDGMVSGAKNPEATSFLRLYAMLKDPDISSGLTAVLNALKAVGSALKKVPDE